MKLLFTCCTQVSYLNRKLETINYDFLIIFRIERYFGETPLCFCCCRPGWFSTQLFPNMGLVASCFIFLATVEVSRRRRLSVLYVSKDGDFLL